MRHYKKIISVSAALAFALGSAGAFAQTTPQSMPASSSTSSMGMHNGSMMHKDKMGMHHTWMAKHTMTGTVTSVDKTTGMVDVNADGKDLHLHFPASKLANLNQGDTITVRLAFRKK